jgi:hypothetical protein
MQDEHPAFEILKIKGKTLTLSKRGGTWKYELREGEATQHMLEALEQRQRLGWETLGLAVMQRLGEKGLKLHEVRL